LIGFHELGDVGRLVVALLAFVSFAVLFLPALRPHALTPTRVMIVCALLTIVAVVTPVRASRDVWSYTSYGRMLSVHGASPFTHVPADFRHDPFLHLVGIGWRHTGSVYGPSWAALSAVTTALAGSSELANRLFFQGIEAVALAVALGIIWRQKRDPVAVAFLGLNPAVIAVVNGGHNDLLVGLTLLAGAVLIADRRPRSAVAVLAFGALIKLVLILPIGALLVYAWYRRGARSALQVFASCGVLVLGAYALAGGTTALGPLLHASGQHSRSSIWQLPMRLFLHPVSIEGHDAATTIGTVALLVIMALSVLVIVGIASTSMRSMRFDAQAAVITGATALVFLLGASYVLPWYVAWGLPLLALVWNSRVAVVAAAQSALIALAYVMPAVSNRGVFEVFAVAIVPTLTLCALVYISVSARRGLLARPIRRPAMLRELAVR
jgi:hypothetical protein